MWTSEKNDQHFHFIGKERLDALNTKGERKSRWRLWELNIPDEKKKWFERHGNW